MSIHPAPDPEPRWADVRRRLAAVDNDMAKAQRDAAPEHAITFQRAQRDYELLNKYKKLQRDALTDLVLFERGAGALAGAPGWWIKVSAGAAVGVLSLSEIALGFNGTRYALGNLGFIETPLDDPAALMASLGLGVGSVMLAKAAGRHLALSERSVFREPDAPSVDAGDALPSGSLDPHGGALIEPSPLDARGGIVSAVESPSVRAIGETERLERGHIFRDERSRSVRRAVAALAVTLGVGLWAINGAFRAEYQQAAAAPTAPVTSSILGTAPAPPVAESGAGLEPLLIALGILFFLAMVVIVWASSSPVAARGRELARRAASFDRRLLKALQKTEDALRAHEVARGKLAFARVNADHLRKTVDATEHD